MIIAKGDVFMNVLYKTTAVSTGGRDGKVIVENSPLEFEMALPTELGGTKKAGANPEQLFAAGYCACFGSALQHVVRAKKLHIPTPSIRTTVGIGKNDVDGFALTVEIIATISGIDQDLADAVVKEAHNVCPYSNATRGNIQVNVIAKIK